MTFTSSLENILNQKHFQSLLGRKSKLTIPRSRLNNSYGIVFDDFTKLFVCKNSKIHSHKVFKGFAQIGKDTRVRATFRVSFSSTSLQSFILAFVKPI